MVPRAFESFWRRLLTAQGEDFHEAGIKSVESNPAPPSQPIRAAGVSAVSTNDRLRAKFEKNGLNCEVEGSPRAVADFLNIVSGWYAGQT
jgi:hypothetical protein